MKFEEYFDDMSEEEVYKFNKEWGIIGDCRCSKIHLKKHIRPYLFEREIFKRSITDEQYDKFIGKKTQEYLKYKVLDYELPDSKTEKYLKDKYILFGDEIPEDFAEIILKYVKDISIFTIEDEPIDVKATIFLKFILMVNHASKNNLEINEMFKRVNAEEGIINRRIINEYLHIRKLLTDNKRYIDDKKFHAWINEKFNVMQDFYYFITVQFNIKNIFDFFKIIIKVFNSSDEWIVTEELENIFEKYKREMKIGIELGLILLKRFEDKSYIKLSPEGWFLATGKSPNMWNKKEILITPLKEVFIPYNFDPFVIQVFDYLGKSNLGKNNKPALYNNDYLIVCDISEVNEDNNIFKVEELTKLIKEYCEDIPDIICDEIIRKVMSRI